MFSSTCFPFLLVDPIAGVFMKEAKEEMIGLGIAQTNGAAVESAADGKF